MKKLSIGFRVLLSRPNKKRECPLFVRLTKEGKRLEFATGIFVDPLRWDQKVHRVTGANDITAKTINKYIETCKVRIGDVYSHLLSQDPNVPLEAIRDRFLGKERKSSTLLDVLDHHLKLYEPLLGKTGYSIGRYKRYKVFAGKIKMFMKLQYGCDDINLNKLSRSFIVHFEQYLKSHDGLDISTAGSYLKILKKLINVALENEWLKVNPFTGFKIKSKTSDRIFLSSKEVETIHTKQFLTERLSAVRDVFIFCIYTGLSHSDVAKLTQDHIVEGEDGKSWLSFKRTKTDVPCKVPLLKTAVEILEKYKEDPECLYKKRLLPVRANQKMNEYLKEIADLCRINKVITCHTARHTYATTILLGNGISIEAACKLLGHRDIRTTQIYAKMTDNRIVQEFKALAHL